MGITETIANIATQLMSTLGYPAVFLGMLLESMIFPVPSEAVMPFAGFLVDKGTFNLALVIIIATLGSIVGSLLSYWIGRYGGLPLVKKFGKYILVTEHDIEITSKFFAKFGLWAIFISRFVPVIRHFISIPAGIAKMKLLPFIILTALGAGIWNTILLYTGITLADNWESILANGKTIDIIVVGVLVALVLWFVISRLVAKRKHKKDGDQA